MHLMKYTSRFTYLLHCKNMYCFLFMKWFSFTLFLMAITALLCFYFRMLVSTSSSSMADTSCCEWSVF